MSPALEPANAGRGERSPVQRTLDHATVRSLLQASGYAHVELGYEFYHGHHRTGIHPACVHEHIEHMRVWRHHSATQKWESIEFYKTKETDKTHHFTFPIVPFTNTAKGA